MMRKSEKKKIRIGPMVYCGPTVREVARQYTVYTAGIPEALRRFLKSCPEAEGLLVPVDRFPEIRKKLETPGSAEATLYDLIKTKL